MDNQGGGMNKPHLKVVQDKLADIPYQEASLDIWDKKYRLKAKDATVIDETMRDTYKRVAKALSTVEPTAEKQQQWYERFVWALSHGAIPAGRIISNAGAQAYKPATSTINCTVSGAIEDSMSDILMKVHEAGLTLKSGCGIGYDFSTLRPKGAYVSGVGAYTSGPLSFMDIYDRMCFTVSSAGGRRGAQMATFDVGHPDVMEFIRAKREHGRLRQFNLSLLITKDFMEAVRQDRHWKLAFPLTDEEVSQDGLDIHDAEQVVWREWPVKHCYITNDKGMVACKVYKSIRAGRLWDVIMSSTYDYAEPGFILIDQYNEMNNNWFCENIRATNPCVTADTWVHTLQGPRQVRELVGKSFHAAVDGELHASGAGGFFRTAVKKVFRLQTVEGYCLRLTDNHKIRRVTGFDASRVQSEWCQARQLKSGDRVLLHDHQANVNWQGPHDFDEGLMVGNLLAEDKLAYAEMVQKDSDHTASATAVYDTATMAVAELTRAQEKLTFKYQLDLAQQLGVVKNGLIVTRQMERASSEFYRGFLRGFFDGQARLESTALTGGFISVSHPDKKTLQSLQRMLLRLAIVSYIDRGRGAEQDEQHPYQQANADPNYELIISDYDLRQFSMQVGFSSKDKMLVLMRAIERDQILEAPDRFTARVQELVEETKEAVYDVQVPGINTFDANGFHAHNCGEQGLPPYGACLLGSVNMTKFVLDPFGDNARFDWEQFREVVAVFTRMLDNVVEVNGLPLAKQRDEILRKRRHGMGYLGLGSTLTMLRMTYGSPESLSFTEQVTKELALVGWRTALELAKEKGPAPIMEDDFIVTKEMLSKRPEMERDGWRVGETIKGKVLHAKYSRYMQRIATEDPVLVEELAERGARFTHHSSIAPTGTISLSLANNASNGIEPSFAHHYFRNVIREGKKSKEKVDVYSFELLAYRYLINQNAAPDAEQENALPDYFNTADDISPKQHVDVQAAAQIWIDSSISKTANVPTDFDYNQFKDIYMYAYERDLKGCTTFRFNPEAFQGVLVKEQDLANTTYQFTLEDGSVIEVNGNEEIEYDGEMHTAANLYDALKEGYYGKF